MKAVQIDTYGGNEVLKVNENVAKPLLKKGQILVENYAAGINPVDLAVRAGYLSKMMPLQFPVTLGGDFAGIVREVSEDELNFKVGDEVYGQAIALNGGSGSFAEFVTANTSNSGLKPKKANFEAAGGLPLVGTSAIQALQDHMNLQKDQKILIHGGAGGIGHIAIQLAKVMGAYVVSTASSDDTEFVKNLGADEIIDYKKQKFEEMLKDFAAVFDTVGEETTTKSFIVLRKGGILVSMTGQPNLKLAEKYGVRAIGQVTQTNTSHLNRLVKLIDGGKIKVYIDKIFSLDQVQEAFMYKEKNHSRGKVVLMIKNPSS